MTRVEREIANPDEALVQAMREVDAMLPGSPPIAPAKAPPPLSLVNCSWHAGAAQQYAVIAQKMARDPTWTGPLALAPSPWFAPYIACRTGSEREEYILHLMFGGARVSREWLESHRHDIVQAIRRRAGRDE